VTVVEPSVLVVEDDAMVRGWVRLSLRDSEFRIVGEAEDAVQARALIERRRPDVILVDYRLPDRAGTELIRDLRQEGFAAPVVLMTANNERGLNEAVRAVGGQGTVLKTGSTEEMLGALREVLAGGQAFDPRHPPRDPSQGALSRRERDVLRLVAAGATNRDVAAELGVGDETVKTLLSRTFAKLGARKRAEAVSRAHDLGLL
jgi:DNA-binding NarL/FixJ family response regulator